MIKGLRKFKGLNKKKQSVIFHTWYFWYFWKIPHTFIYTFLFYLQPELQFLTPFPTAALRIRGAWTIVFIVIILNFDNIVFILYLGVFSAMGISFADLFLRNSKIIVGKSDV